MRRSIIISYKESGEDRKNNLKKVLHYLSWLLDTETEIVLVEQDSESKIDWLPEIKKYEQINHIFIKNDGIFNKGWGYNVGVKVAKGDFLIFNDSDMYLKLKSYNYALSLLGRFDVVNPYTRICYLDEKNSDIFTSTVYNYNFNIINNNTFTQVYVISGGIFMMKKEKYLDLKGFDEDCYGYGHEDDIFDTKIKKLGLTVQTVNDVAIHTFHQGTTRNDDYYAFVNINKMLFNEYVDMTEIQLRDKIQKVKSFGEQDKVNVLPIRQLKMELYKQATETILDSILTNINTEFIDSLIKESAEKAAEQAHDIFVEAFTKKLKKEFENIKFTEKDKKTLAEKIMNRLRL